MQGWCFHGFCLLIPCRTVPSQKAQTNEETEDITMDTTSWSQNWFDILGRTRWSTLSSRGQRFRRTVCCCAWKKYGMFWKYSQTVATPVNSPKKQQVKSLLTLQRANNIVILLNTCKLSKGELKNAMMNFDESVLSVEMLMRLRSMVPTDDEKKVINENHWQIVMICRITFSDVLKLSVQQENQMQSGALVVHSISASFPHKTNLLCLNENLMCRK